MIKHILHLTCLAAVCTLMTTQAFATKSLTTLELPPAKAEPWRFKEFPLMAWWGPPGTATQEDFDRYRDAGLNLYMPNCDIAFTSSTTMAKKAGLKIMPFRTLQGFGLPADPDLKFPEDDPAIVGWLTHDEPSGHEGVTEAIKAVNEQMRKDPTRWTLFNMLPPHAQVNPGPEEVMAAAAKAGMPVLSYDNYVLHKTGDTNPDSHFKHLEIYRKASLKHDLPFWAFALTIAHWDYRESSESDLRWKQFTNLAYGAKGLWYFTYWAPEKWDRWSSRAFIDAHTSQPTAIYDYARAINKEVSSVGNTLLKLKNEAVYHTSPPPDQEAWIADKHWIADVQGENVLVSFFRHEDGTEYAWVVNKKHGADKSASDAADQIKLRFDSAVKEIHAVSWLDGNKGPLTLDNQSAVLEVAGGTGVLLRNGK